MIRLRVLALVLFRVWSAASFAALIAPFSIHLGVFDALRLPCLLLALPVIGVMLVAGRRRLALAPTLLAAALSVPWLTSGHQPAPTTSHDISMIVLPSSSRAAIAYAVAQDPDVIVIPDFSETTAAALAPGRSIYRFPTDGPQPSLPLALLPLAANYVTWAVDGTGGVGIFLRREATAPESVRLRPTDGPRMLLVDARIRGIDLTIAATHLPRPFPVGAWGDQVGAAAALEHALNGITQPIILTGDFNALPWSAILDGLASAIVAEAPSWVGTFPAGLPVRLPIDQVRVGRGLSLTGLAAGPDVSSWHLPLEAVLSRAQP